VDVLAPRLSWRRLPWVAEIISIGIGYAFYAIVRVRAPQSVDVSYTHAKQVIHLEQVLGVYHELSLNQFITGKLWLEVSASYYYATLHFIVTPVVLAFLWRRRQAVYAPLRSALVIATAAALVVYATWPLAPPRFADRGGFSDTVTVHPVAWASGHGVSGFINEFAAMPSLHVGWAVWCAIAIITSLKTTWRYLAWVYPVATMLVVVATANHYWLDGVAGTAVIGVALWLCGVRPTGYVAASVLPATVETSTETVQAELAS
jgi:hypothetical protein